MKHEIRACLGDDTADRVGRPDVADARPSWVKRAGEVSGSRA
jgi:hypothetical protein